MPDAQCRKVLLPEPDGPITAVNVPRRMPTVTSSSAVTAPPPEPYTFRTACSDSASALITFLLGWQRLLAKNLISRGGAERSRRLPGLRWSRLYPQAGSSARTNRGGQIRRPRRGDREGAKPSVAGDRSHVDVGWGADVQAQRDQRVAAGEPAATGRR